MDTLLQNCQTLADTFLKAMPDTGEADDNVLGWTREDLETFGGEVILWFLEDENLVSQASNLSVSDLFFLLAEV